ncbi:MAG: TetR/AcrR family transcriptional regulator [Deltaproteobacteria bacterium]|nr:TetR/AcrR family transcriptional regulator [Deltaproteobacteria bacterium]
MITELRRLKNRARRDATRQRLIEVAKKIFAEKGYHNTIVSDIVKGAGVGQGTFYRNFKDKRDIFENLLNELTEKLLSSFSDMSSELPQNSNEYREASIRAIKRMINIVVANKELVKIYIKEAITVDKELENKIYEFQIRFAQLAKYYLDHAIEKGFARRCNSDIVSKSIVGLGFSLLNMWLGGIIKEEDVDDIITEVIDFAFFGLVGSVNPKGVEL